MLKKSVLFTMICLLMPAICFAIIPIPARIGGTVTIGGAALSQADATNYSFRVTRSNGTDLSPATAQSAGLNATDWYIIDIPMYDANDQTGGAHPGDSLKIHVYNGGTELNVTAPSDGRFNCGDSGSTAQINLAAQAEPANIPTLSEWGMILFAMLLASSIIYTMRRNNTFDQLR